VFLGRLSWDIGQNGRKRQLDVVLFIIIVCCCDAFLCQHAKVNKTEDVGTLRQAASQHAVSGRKNANANANAMHTRGESSWPVLSCPVSCLVLSGPVPVHTP
jgi:hypothetical protein